MVVVVIEANLADGEELGMTRKLPQLVEMGVGGFRGFVRMDTGRRVHPVVPVGNLERLREVGGPGSAANRQEIRESSGARALDHRVAVGVEGGIVEMAVGINVHGG